MPLLPKLCSLCSSEPPSRGCGWADRAKRLRGKIAADSETGLDDRRKRGCMKVVVLVAARHQSGSGSGADRYMLTFRCHGRITGFSLSVTLHERFSRESTVFGRISQDIGLLPTSAYDVLGRTFPSCLFHCLALCACYPEYAKFEGTEVGPVTYDVPEVRYQLAFSLHSTPIDALVL
ncbi:hypothetical protein CONLIGDRAFT_641558 [Coniochaeta ligniaria NRRL 30616]|uniref:Uncharacterized protein n=1 Tax=Coniochaeta ligniaria NRRL 30616 TaxID=1408157 RepID=A0A1J7IVN8_9PEZI|nr:hypothetical protein CONLIGDRAFT_641558 [Coniochaeta ligniaria NRRL 30616]